MDETGTPEPERLDHETSSGDAPVTEFATGAFELVTVEPRVAILDALATYQAENPREPTLGFTELRERAAIEDSGNFSYHLEKLKPACIKRTDEGYSLTWSGRSLVGVLQAGVGARTTRGPVTLDATCGICGTELTASYEDRLLSVTCANGHRFPTDDLPPNAVSGRPIDDVITIQTRRTRHHLDLVREGVCPACFATVELEYEVLDSPRAAHILIATCGDCGRVSSSTIGSYLLTEPVVVAFYHDHGVDLTETPFWAVELTIADPTVHSEEPLRLSLSVERDGERLTLFVDEHARLLDSDRTTDPP